MLRVVVEEGGRPWMDILSRKQQNRCTRWKVKVVKNTREKNAQTLAPFPGRRVERLRVVLTWAIKSTMGDKQCRRGGISVVSIVQVIQMKQCCQNVAWSNDLQ